MAMSRDRLPHLSHFLDAYLHQDWQIFGDTVEAVVAAYGGDSSREDVAALADEIEGFLSTDRGNVGLIYRDLYPNSVQPDALGITAESWLGILARSARGLVSDAVPIRSF